MILRCQYLHSKVQNVLLSLASLEAHLSMFRYLHMLEHTESLTGCVAPGRAPTGSGSADAMHARTAQTADSGSGARHSCLIGLSLRPTCNSVIALWSSAACVWHGVCSACVQLLVSWFAFSSKPLLLLHMLCEDKVFVRRAWC